MSIIVHHLNLAGITSEKNHLEPMYWLLLCKQFAAQLVENLLTKIIYQSASQIQFSF